MGRTVRDFEVHGVFEGYPIKLGILGRDSTMATLTAQELWPGIKIQSVRAEDQWS
jgi:hypothetical protein